MDPLEMVVYIVLITAIAGFAILSLVFKVYLRSRELKAQAMPEDVVTGTDLKPLLEQVARLEERMRVLERIATDKSEHLTREFAELDNQ